MYYDDEMTDKAVADYFQRGSEFGELMQPSRDHTVREGNMIYIRNSNDEVFATYRVVGNSVRFEELEVGSQ